MPLACKLDVTVQPLRVARGQRIQGRCVVTGTMVSIAGVMMEIGGTPLSQKMNMVAPSVYEYAFVVPRLVPAGQYTIHFVAVDQQGNRSDPVQVIVTVV